MSDNIDVTPGSGKTISADDVGGGLLVQRVKVQWGPDGTASDADTASGKALPIQLRGSAGKDLLAGHYETIAASATDQALGATGATGDFLAGILVVPGTTSPGAVSIKDGSGSSITLFAGGSSSVSNLVPFFIPLGLISTGGAWKVTTGTSVSAIGIGTFT
ncbi:hypothetical protein EN788_22170 [Mesorhizobium sp. M2D.F.Ca.ET.145.01.1.1]|uniref:hypothetical protein n=1 Tax=unclassified Mesorhizobium TaxID=325217 RepID=UPI000FCAFAB3|nr:MULTISPECIES: hypothetical protein [unclassified Mesorhizobium]TGU44625.1 hypothetical protein EN789_21720 [bacterium M00.F.Ca.ET.146.01.1.1]TGU58453.1 hypothetical protein EN791_021720 [Mesorhizobium sp. M2D.F.Ca.ET.148.01.1.1]TGU64385.1 hypothetical protein EN790_21715 [Mesorhizobium sp. M2D.F.Ca.ET.147.01.1.1]TGW09961.1 hypothetical protein EN788_22170 [Mesorhizobium sp. M2D.F.Ca.ET.145.01.1.1]